ncbi:MAG: hypothetical protein Q9227_000903 [Pyrenula ochraceoflavens]
MSANFEVPLDMGGNSKFYPYRYHSMWQPRSDSCVQADGQWQRNGETIEKLGTLSSRDAPAAGRLHLPAEHRSSLGEAETILAGKERLIAWSPFFYGTNSASSTPKMSVSSRRSTVSSADSTQRSFTSASSEASATSSTPSRVSTVSRKSSTSAHHRKPIVFGDPVLDTPGLDFAYLPDASLRKQLDKYKVKYSKSTPKAELVRLLKEKAIPLARKMKRSSSLASSSPTVSADDGPDNFGEYAC